MGISALYGSDTDGVRKIFDHAFGKGKYNLNVGEGINNAIFFNRKALHSIPESFKKKYNLNLSKDKPNFLFDSRFMNPNTAAHEATHARRAQEGAWSSNPYLYAMGTVGAGLGGGLAITAGLNAITKAKDIRSYRRNFIEKMYEEYKANAGVRPLMREAGMSDKYDARVPRQSMSSYLINGLVPGLAAYTALHPGTPKLLSRIRQPKMPRFSTKGSSKILSLLKRIL